MNQVGFDDIFKRPLILPDSCREGIQADGAPAELLDQRRQDSAIKPIESGLVHIESVQSEACRLQANPRLGTVSHGAEVSDTTQ